MRAAHGKDGGFLVGGEEVMGLWSLCSLAGPQVKMWGGGGPPPVSVILWFSMRKGEGGSKWRVRREAAEMGNTRRVRGMA